MKKRRVKICIVLILLAACAAASLYLFKTAGGAGGKARAGTESAGSEAAEEAGGQDEGQGYGQQAAADETVNAVIFAASDYQADASFAEPEDTLRGLLGAAQADGTEPEAAILCGDYTNDPKLHDYQLSPEDSIDEISEVIDEEAPSVKDENTIFIQGNHDRLTESIAESGLHEYGDYLVYVLNTENDFPWKQGKTAGCLDKVKTSSKAMKKCFDGLIANGETRPVIIAGHVPLHYTARTSSRHSTGDNLYSRLIFDVVNNAAKDLDIVYLFGHNHSKGWDCYMGGSSVYKAPGDTLLLPEFDETRITTDEFTVKTLNFTYMNAGYTGYYMNCAPDEYGSYPDPPYRAADETLTCSIISIYDDRIEIARYDESGRHNLGGAGEADPYKDGIDEGLIGPEYYSKAVKSPAVITRGAAQTP